MVHHITPSSEICEVCNKPFNMFWYNREQTSGQRETGWGLSVELGNVEFKETFHTTFFVHGTCLEKVTGRRPKGLRELNEERKKEKA